MKQIFTAILLTATLSACGGDTSKPALLDDSDQLPVVQTQPPSDPLLIVAQQSQESAPVAQTEQLTVTRAMQCVEASDPNGGASFDDFDTNGRTVEFMSDGVTVIDPHGKISFYNTDEFNHYLNLYDRNWNLIGPNGMPSVTTTFFANQSITCADSFPERPAPVVVQIQLPVQNGGWLCTRGPDQYIIQINTDGTATHDGEATTVETTETEIRFTSQGSYVVYSNQYFGIPGYSGQYGTSCYFQGD